MRPGSSKLCSICVTFDVRKLLLAAEAQPPGNYNVPDAADSLECLRPALYQFSKQHPSLSSLRSSAGECDFCRSIWKGYAGTGDPAERTNESMDHGMSSQQIWIGTTAWDATLHGLPQIAITRHGEKGAIRFLASFEVCALRGEICVASLKNQQQPELIELSQVMNLEMARICLPVVYTRTRALQSA